MQVLDSLIEGMKQLPDARDQQHYAWALLWYLSEGSEPDGLRPVASAMLTANRPVLDNSRKRSAAGAKGGSRRASKSEANGQANAKQTCQKTASEEEEEKEKEEPSPIGDGKKKRPRFEPPTSDEVKAYAEAKGLLVDAERFVDYYASNGWRVGRNPMRDWRATVRNWARKPSSESKDGGEYDEYFDLR